MISLPVGVGVSPLRDGELLWMDDATEGVADPALELRRELEVNRCSVGAPRPFVAVAGLKESYFHTLKGCSKHLFWKHRSELE